MPHKIHFVLVATSHPGNIGASARAMKTMGLGSLRLVTPSGFPSAEVTARAAGASDVLADAGCFDSLADAIGDCSLVLATSARQRSIPWPEYTPRQGAERIAEVTASGADAAVVFGPERSGLSNTDLGLCSGAIRIPTNPEFHSLNLAAAVQVIAYEIRLALTVPEADGTKGDWRRVTAQEMEMLQDQLVQCMTEVGFFDPENPRRLLLRLQRLLNRLELDENEYNILRGFIAAVRGNVHGTDPRRS